MSGGRERRRDLSNDGQIPQLFQGANYENEKGRRVTVYPGDREIRVREELTIQIHTLLLRMDGEPDLPDVPALAVWVPRSMHEEWVVQTDVPV